MFCLAFPSALYEVRTGADELIFIPIMGLYFPFREAISAVSTNDYQDNITRARHKRRDKDRVCSTF